VLEKTLDMTNTHRLDEKTGQVSTIPPPSGRGEDSTGEADMIQKMHDIHSWAMQEVIENEKQRQRDLAVAKIEYYLRGSPLRGYGPLMVSEGERTGVNPYLCAAVAEAESSLAHNCFHPCNAWGMGQESYGSWEQGIIRWFNNADKNWPDAQNGYDLERPDLPYCATHQAEYAAHVTGVVDAIERIEI